MSYFYEDKIQNVNDQIAKNTPTPVPLVVSVPLPPAAPAPPNAMSPSVSSSEKRYVALALETLEKIQKAENGPKREYADFAELKATVDQSTADYSQIIVPPRFVKADALIRNGMAEERLALDLMDLGFKTSSRSMVDDAEPHYMNAGAIFKRAAEEMQRILTTN